MTTRTLLNLALAGIALLLVLVILYKPGTQQPAEAPPLTHIDAAGIDRIRVTRKERTPLTFTRQGSDWYLDQEPPLPASRFQLQALLDLPGARSDRRYPVAELDLASTGLEPPQARLLFDDTLIDIGTTEPLERKRYVRHGDTVYLLTDKYQHLINADWSNFVERRLLPEDATLKDVQLPGDPELDAAKRQALLAQWQAATATYVRRYQGKVTGETITLTLADNAEHITLGIVQREPELVLARPDWNIQYHFPGQLRDVLLVPPRPEQ